MSKRARKGNEQNNHDRAIKKYAQHLDKNRYSVKADTTELDTQFPMPEIIHGKRPDILASKKGKKLVIEVETPNSLDTKRAKEQRRRFQNWANRKSNRTFQRKMAKDLL
jgi:hypothetical protein